MCEGLSDVPKGLCLCPVAHNSICKWPVNNDIMSLGNGVVQLGADQVVGDL